MSTYNGEKYLKEQLDSIFAQEGVEVHLLVRDDGSKDNTINILKEYNLELIEGINLGPTNSFLELIQLAGEYDYYAFADQDDVWDKDKLFEAVKQLEKSSSYAVYSGNTRLVDKKLDLIRVEEFEPKIDLGSAIVKNFVTGCTTVFNRSLFEVLKKVKPKFAASHDWWVNLVCLSLGGTSIYDVKPHMSYRQHENNVVGGNATFIRKWKSRLYKFLRKPYRRDLMAKELIDNYGELISEKNLNILMSMEKRKNNKALKTNSKIDNLIFKICLLFRKV